MNTKTLAIASTLIVSLLVATIVIGDGYEREEHEEHEEYEERWSRLLPGRWRVDVPAVNDIQYREECGSCHLAYQPGLLPARSWQRMMDTLDDHFGGNAELPAQTLAELTDYLDVNAADRVRWGRSAGISTSLDGDQTPLRISDTPYFVRKHHEIPPQLVFDNGELGSWSKCDGCHTKADAGSYNEHEVSIPGIGRWDD